MELERHTVSSSLEAALHDLKALAEEARTHHELMRDELRKVQNFLQLHRSRCQDELDLLRESPTLQTVPDDVLEALALLTTNRWAGGAELAGNVAPAHWAARHGRRDIIEFIRAQAGSTCLLNARDRHGRTPLSYAEEGQRRRQRMHFEELPASYAAVLSQIEEQGWQAMNWKDNYTMLHWAAEKGKLDLARYLLTLGADPQDRDGHGRTPIDAAKKIRHYGLVAHLQEAASRLDSSQATRLAISDSF